MIFLTLGTQLPFDRLVRILDAVSHETDEPIFGQIGHSNYKPQGFEWVPFLSPSELQVKVVTARILVGHAGMGTILTAAKYNKPLIIMPRLAAYGEHRNDHQLVTAREMSTNPGIRVATNEDDIRYGLRVEAPPPVSFDGDERRERLLTSIRQFILK